jgi:hypothetical protein
VRSISKAPAEPLTLSEATLKSASTLKLDTTQLSEAKALGVGKPIPEAMAISETTSYIGPAYADTSTIAASLTEIVADGISTSTITFTVRDMWGNPLQGIPVAFSVTWNEPLKGMPAGLIHPTTTTTDQQGEATATLTSLPIVGSVNVTAKTTRGTPVEKTIQIRYIEDSISFQLLTGFNLISIPLKPLNTTITTVLARGLAVNVEELPHYVLVVAYYNTTAAEWKVYVPGWGGNLLTMEPGRGYWIVMTQPATFRNYGFIMTIGEPPPTYPLPAGWSMIGVTSKSQIDADVYLKNVAGKYTSIWQFTPQGWQKLIPNGSETDTDPSDDLIPGRGYWIYMKESGVIVP